MLSIITIDEYLSVKLLLNQIRCFKLLRQRGYKIPEYKISIEYYEALDNFGSAIIDILEQRREISNECILVKESHASIKEYYKNQDGYDDISLHHITMLHNDIQVCREILYRTKGTDKELISKLNYMIDVDESLVCDEDYFDLLVPSSLEYKPVFAVSSTVLINIGFILGYLDLLDYCKEVINNDRCN